MKVGEEQKEAAVMGSGLCVELQAAIASDRGNERWIKRFLCERRRDGSEECALLVYDHLLGDFCERQSQLPCDRGKTDNTFRNNCRAFH